jgi:hypothetical protein
MELVFRDFMVASSYRVTEIIQHFLIIIRLIIIYATYMIYLPQNFQKISALDEVITPELTD